VTTIAKRKPLGIKFDKEVFPIKITKENPGSHGEDLGIQPGWVLTKINYVDIGGMGFGPCDKLLHEEVGKLPGPVTIPLVWDTGRGDKTVWASKRPLGLHFNKGTLPIKITKEMEGHGKDIGIEVGWSLKSINGIDLTRYPSSQFQEVDDIFKGEVAKLTLDGGRGSIVSGNIQ